jgi:hypothetical protein
MRWSPV